MPATRILTIVLILFAGSAANVMAASFTAIADGDWGSAPTWSCTASCAGEDGIPDADDTVTIPNPRVVTVTGAQAAHILNVNGGGTLALNAGSTVTLDGTASSFFTNGGTTNGTGTVRTTPGTGTTGINIDGIFTAPLEIGAGTTNASSSTIGGPITILSGATMATSNQTINHSGDLTVNSGGTLTSPNGAYNASGVNIINNGTLSMAGNLNFLGGAGQSLSGTGLFTGDYDVSNGTTVTLTSNVVFGDGNITSTSVGIATGGTVAVGTNTLTLNGGSLSGAGATSGTGSISFQGTSSLTSGGLYTAPVIIVSGTTTGLSGTFGGSLTVLNGATFNSTNQTVTVNGDLTVSAVGTITKTSGNFGVAGANVVNNGTITGGAFVFHGGALQTYSGAGTLTAGVSVNNGTTVTLTSNVTIGDGATATSVTLNTGSMLAIGANTLTLNDVTFSGAGATSGTGSINFEGPSSLAANVNQLAPVVIASGTTTGSGTFGGSLTVLNGATFDSTNQTVTVNGDLNNSGTITKTSANFGVAGAHVVNNGTITGGAFVFHGGALQTYSGTGTLTAGVTVNGGTTVTLTSNVTIGNGIAATTLAVNTGGTIAIVGNTLTLNGVAVSGAGAYTSTGAGVIRTQGTSSINVGAAFTGSLEINSGTTNAFSTVLGGTLTVLNGATLTTTNQTITVNGDLTNNGTITKTSGNFGVAGANIVNNGTIGSAGSFVFHGGTQNLSGTGSISMPATINNGTTVTLGSSHQLATLAVATGGTINTSTFTLFLNGAGTPLTGAGTIANVNITYNGIAAQAVQAVASYNRLGIDNAAGVTLSAAETVGERLSLTNGAFNVGSNLSMAENSTIERRDGTLSNSPQFNGGLRYSLEYTGSNDVTMGPERNSQNLRILTINKTSPTNTVTADVATIFVETALNLTSGRFQTTPGGTIVVQAGATSTGSASSFVIGQVQKDVVGASLFTFHVGTVSGYSPITVNFDSLGFAAQNILMGGTAFQVTANDGIAPGSGLAPAKALNRYWTLNEFGIGQADITFQYQQADVPGPANESGFDFFRNGGGFFDPSALDTANNIATLNNVTQFSDWTLYDPTPNPSTTVSNAGDSGPGSLRQAVLDANALAGADTILFDGSFGSSQMIVLSSGEIVVTDELTITGPGADLLTISGNSSSRILSVEAGETASVSGVTMTDGNGAGGDATGSGGAIYNLGNLALTNVAVSGNSASANGGGIFSQSGTLDMSGSTVSGNLLAVNGGGIYFDGTTSSILNSTISGNSATADGGGIDIVSGTVNISYSTIAGNSADGNGGGVSGTSTVGNTIIGDNTAVGTGPDYNGSVNSLGYNLLEDTTGATITGDLTGNITGQDPNLGPLQNNMGPTFTHALLPGSPAIDAADPANFPATDQRAIARPMDGDSAGGARADIGAFEMAATTAADVVVTGRVLTSRGRAISRAIVRLQNTNGDVLSARTNTFGYFRFKSVPAGESYVLNVSARGHTFSPQLLTVNDNVSGLIITPTGRR